MVVGKCEVIVQPVGVKGQWRTVRGLKFQTVHGKSGIITVVYLPASRQRDPKRNINFGDIIVVGGTDCVWTSRALLPLYMCTTTPSRFVGGLSPSG